VRAELDKNKYPKGVKTSDAQLAAINLTRTASTETGTTPSRHKTQVESFIMHNALVCQPELTRFHGLSNRQNFRIAGKNEAGWRGRTLRVR